MNLLLPFLLSFVLLVAVPARGQHHTEKAKGSQEPLSFQPVLSQLLSDPELNAYKLESSLMTIAPGATDTISHRHDCELFGYVVEGEVLIGLDNNTPRAFTPGQMFYEKRNVLHSLTKNAKADGPAKVLLLFIIKNGRSGYRREYSK